MKTRALLVIAAALAAAAPAAAADVTLRFASISQPATRSYKEQLVPLKQAIEHASQGSVEVDLRGLGEFGKPVELFNLVEKGDIDIASTVQGYMPGRFPRSTVMEMPMLFGSAESGTYAMWKLFEEGLIAKDYESVKVLSLYVLPPYAIFTNGADITSLRDLRGLRLRSPSLTVGLALTRLGAIPLGLAIDQIGPSLSGKLIDGITYSYDAASTTQGDGKLLIEQVSVLCDAKFAAPALMIVMNKGAYERLPAEVRTFIDTSTGLDFSVGLAAQRDRWEDETRRKFSTDTRYTVRQFTPEQRNEMVQRVAPIADEWVASVTRQGVDGAKLLARARELIRQRAAASSNS